MSVIIRLQNLPLTASSLDVRNFFHGLSIPDGGVHIVGGPEGDAFIAFSTDEDARQAMRLTGKHLKEERVSLLLSSRNEMYKVIEQARIAALTGGGGGAAPPSHHQTSMSSSSSNHTYNNLLGGGDSTPPPSHHVSSSSNNLHGHYQSSNNNSVSSSMSPTSSTNNSANDYLRSITGHTGGNQADLSSNPALLFSTMAAIPSATLGASQNAFLGQQHNQGFHGLGSSANSSAQQQQQGQGYSKLGGNGNPTTNTNAPPPSSVFPNGNPFLIPPPNLAGMAGMSLPFPGILQGANGQNASGTGLGSGGGSGGPLGMGQAPASTVMNLTPNFLNSQISMAGHAPNSLNPFANGAATRMGMLNNGGMGAGPQAALAGAGLGGPRHLNSFGLGNTFGVGVGANNNAGGRQQQQQQHFGGPRAPFGNHGGNDQQNQNQGQNRFQFGAIPSGRMDTNSRDNSKQGRSPSRERRGGPGLANDAINNRRRRSRSRDRDRAGGERRRRRSRSHSRSRSRSRDRGVGGAKRRDSRDKRDTDRRGRTESSPEKSSQESSGSRRRTEHEPSPVPNSMNTTTEEWPGAKLTGVPSDASYREIKDFIKGEVMGGSDGVVRLYDEGVAYLKLPNPSQFPKVYRFNGAKLRGSVVTIEGITMEVWTQEYKLNKSRLERDIVREREEREKEREQNRKGSDREKEHGTSRGDRDSRHSQNSHSSGSSGHHRSSRFSNASVQSSCIAIRGLAPTVTRQELVTRYLRDTPCQDVVLIAAPTPTNRHSVTAFVQFESAQVSQTVIDGIVRSPLGTQLVVEICDAEDLSRAKERTSGSSSSGMGKSGPMNNTLMMMSQAQDANAKSIFELDLGLDDETTTIIMKGAPPNITERDVFDFFSDIGLAPMNVRILYDTDGQCSGQVICEFPDNNKAKRATTKDGMLFGRGQISVSFFPSRNRKVASSGSDFTAAAGGGNGGGQLLLQPNFLNSNRNNNPRPGLLGPAPPRGGSSGGGNNSSGSGMSRFSNPNPTSTPNIFEQALQQQSTPMTRPPPTIGRGGGNNRGRGERMSRFSNNDNGRNDFRNQNSNGLGRGGRGGGGHMGKKDDILIGEDEMAVFNKKGCVIGLENIPYKASMDDILQYLEELLKIRIAPSRIIRRYDDKQKPTGDARVAFDTEFEAKLACDRLRGTHLWKRLISANVID